MINEQAYVVWCQYSDHSDDAEMLAVYTGADAKDSAGVLKDTIDRADPSRKVHVSPVLPWPLVRFSKPEGPAISGRPSLAPEIMTEVCVAIRAILEMHSRDTDHSALLSILGSFRDTLSDASVLNALKSYNTIRPTREPRLCLNRATIQNVFFLGQKVNLPESGVWEEFPVDEFTGNGSVSGTEFWMTPPPHNLIVTLSNGRVAYRWREET